MPEYEVKIIESLKSFELIKDEWNELLLESRTKSIFLTWEWLYTWAESYIGKLRELFIIAIYKSGNLVGAAPWYLRHFRYGPFKIRRLEFLGTPETGSDYLDILTKNGFEYVISSKLYEHLMTAVPEKWDCLYLRDIPANSFLLVDFIVHFLREGKHIDVRQDSLCPIIRLPETWEGFIASLSANRRQQLKRHAKKLFINGKVKLCMILNPS
ncbi:MAG: GNAT family N-acetyltransferase [Candidatus Heimdallarchaeota archaeon]